MAGDSSLNSGDVYQVLVSPYRVVVLRIPILIDEFSKSHVIALSKGDEVDAEAKNSWVAFVAVTRCIRLEYRTKSCKTHYLYLNPSQQERALSGLTLKHSCPGLSNADGLEIIEDMP